MALNFQINVLYPFINCFEDVTDRLLVNENKRLLKSAPIVNNAQRTKRRA